MPLKIIHIIPNLSKGGAERLVLTICNELDRRTDIVVKLITFSTLNQYPYLTNSLDWATIPSTVHLHVFKPSSTAIDALQKEIETFAPDIIHTHLFEAEIVSRSCFYPKAIWVSHCHDNMVQFSPFNNCSFGLSKEAFTQYYEKHYLLKRYKANGGNRFIAISVHTQQYFEKALSLMPFKQVVLMFNAIDFKRFNRMLSEKEIKREGVVRLISVGSFSENKNHLFLIEVIAYCKRHNYPCQLTLLGDGPMRESIEAKIQAYQLEDRVFLKGNVDEVEQYLQESDIYIHAAKSEAFGLVLVEAMAAGLPVITLDGGGNRDIIKQGENGFIIEKGNISAFADKIKYLIEHPTEYAHMSAYATSYAKQFDIVPYVDKLVHYYRSLLGNMSS